jgi:hypothetical protein
MSFLIFEEGPSSISGKTKTWIINGGKLGSILWYPHWRKYCFFPQASTLFDNDCLLTIANFCSTETQKHKDAHKDAHKGS